MTPEQIQHLTNEIARRMPPVAFERAAIEVDQMVADQALRELPGFQVVRMMMIMCWCRGYTARHEEIKAAE